MNPGSLRGSIFNLCILSLGTGLLAIPQKIGYMSMVLSPIIIILSGLANYWSLFFQYFFILFEHNNINS